MSASDFEPIYVPWYLPEAPEHKVLGSLTRDAAGHLVLTLNGLLGGAHATPDEAADLLRGEHRIVGQDGLGHGGTCEDCILQRNDPPPLPPRQIWHVGQFLRGGVFDATEPWAFYGVRYRLPFLTGFTQRRNLEIEISRGEDHQPTAVVHTIPVRSWPLWTREGFEVNLGTNLSRTELDETRLELDSRVELSVHTGVATERGKFLRRALRPMQVLIGLATGEFTSPQREQVALERFRSDGRNRDLLLYFQPHAVETPTTSVTAGFSYTHFAALGAERIDTWLERVTQLEPVTDLYLALLHDQGYAESAFLLAAQALETYHRRTGSLTLVPKADWETLRPNLVGLIEASLPADDGRRALVNKLAFHNEVTLSQRLQALLQSLEPHAAEICGTQADRFVSQVVRTRNYLTHWDSRGERHAVRGTALLHLTSRLVGFLELLLLSDVGLTGERSAVEAILKRRVRWLPKGVQSDG